MTHQEHVHLIQKAITQKSGIWADLGSGDGAFTLALADLLGKNAIIYSLDLDNQRLEKQKLEFQKHFPNTQVTFIQADFTQQLELPPLEGIMMANALHYVQDQTSFLKHLHAYLKPSGKLVLIEYNTDKGQAPWVPYALSFEKFNKLAQESGWKDIQLLEKIPSTYWNEMYSAEAIK
jgi:ubiquinone/menaquinone biosynthesis C-methylase UbiE